MKQPMSMSEQFCANFEASPMADLEMVLRNLCTGHCFNNITYYSSAIPTRDGTESVLITTYPQEWVTHYFERRYEAIDPVLRAGSCSLLPVDWSGLATADEVATKFFGEAREFGIGTSGLTVPVRGVYGEQAMLSLNSECAEKEWKAFCHASSSDFLYLSHLIHEKIIASRYQQEDQRRTSITRREAEVLRWAARGKTAWETAKILGLTEKTVSFYLKNVCAKLGVVTKTQAVAKAVRERLILY